ncbi:MAG: cation:proton antiporter [Planctomycetes bacterium]|nr:cation:proton antiporter [Planctomycetota bacterium]
MEFWPTLFDVGVLLGVAFLLGAVCEQLRQSSLLGYLLAGMLLGPHALDVVSTSEEVQGLAEIGVSTLLFSLGLEFSWRRLRSLGPRALGGGVLQVTLSLGALALVVAATLGVSWSVGLVIGAAFTLSSTAGVLRILMARSEIDSAHGRLALGVLLLQDLAVVPLVLMAGQLGGTPTSEHAGLGQTVLALLGMVVGFYVAFNHLVPRVLLATSSLRNRELPVLVAVFGALSAIYIAHSLGLSPAVGAFIAGMLLGESPLATQVRADLSVLRTLLVTVFFCSVGMLADPRWIVENLLLTGTVAALIVVTKALVCFIALRSVGVRAPAALATGIALSQVGEFAFLIAESSRGSLLDDALFMVIVSTMMVTLLMTPFLVSFAPRLARLLLAPLARLGLGTYAEPDAIDSADRGHVILIGYGPAGERCGAEIRATGSPVTVLDLNPQLAARAEEAGFAAHVGDASHPELHEHLHVGHASTVVIGLTDPRTVERIAQSIRIQSEHIPIVIRSRYHKYTESLRPTGASAVIDEEVRVGEILGRETRRILDEPAPEALGKEDTLVVTS